MLANKMMGKHEFFSLQDSREFYIYENGVYSNEGSELRIEKMVRDCYHELFMCMPAEIRAKIPIDAKSNHIAETLRLLRSEHAISREELDKAQLKSGLLNFKNCMVKISTGEILSHSGSYRLIRQFPFNYDPNAKCPAIEKFLSEAVNSEDKSLLLEIIGYLMIPDTSIQKAIMVYGPPGTGKSIFLNVLGEFIGKKNCSYKSLQQLEEDKYATSGLYGKLVNIFADLSDGLMNHDSTFKSIVGGDRMPAERKYEHPFEFENTARLIFSANHENLPRIKTGDKAFYRRWILVSFPHVHIGKDKGEDIRLISKLTTPEELAGLANIAIDALRKVIKQRGFAYDKTPEEIEKEYNIHSSSAHTFAGTQLQNADTDCNKTIMYEFYCAWAQKQGITPVANTSFSKAMKHMGHEDGRQSTGDRTYVWKAVSATEELEETHAEYLINKNKLPSGE